MDHEYVLCYANSGFSFAGSAKTFADYGNPDGDPRGDWANFNLTKGQSYKDRPRSFYPLQNPNSGVWYPCNPDRVWAFSSESRIKPGQRLVGESMEEVIREQKVLWPKDDKVVTYSSMQELLAAIDAGTAPRHIRRGLPELEFWISKPIGYGMPRYKMHKSELDTTVNPLSTWFASTGQNDDFARADNSVETIEVGFTAEGASLLTAMLGTKDFSYPKPLSLAQALVQQATRPGDIVLDFFAGSGTTAHAVLAQNAGDDGGRRFILVSSTEATEKDPSRNVCRDICQRRVAKAISGYGFPTKNGLKEISGLDGDFAYLCCRRIPPGKLLEIDHAQVWTALQLIHREVLAPHAEASFLWAGDDEQGLLYVPRFRREDAAALRKQVSKSAAVILYSWQPETLRQHVSACNSSGAFFAYTGVCKAARRQARYRNHYVTATCSLRMPKPKPVSTSPGNVSIRFKLNTPKLARRRWWFGSVRSRQWCKSRKRTVRLGCSRRLHQPRVNLVRLRPCRRTKRSRLRRLQRQRSLISVPSLAVRPTKQLRVAK